MSMNTYPLCEPCALVITPRAACAILLQSYFTGSEAEKHEIPKDVLEALTAGRAPWGCAGDPIFKKSLEDGSWFNISDAYELLENEGVTELIHCLEFTGTAITPDEGFGTPQELNFENDVIAMLAPEHSAGLFRQAYQSPDSLVAEYENKLGGRGGPGFPIKSLVMDVTGTYIC